MKSSHIAVAASAMLVAKCLAVEVAAADARKLTGAELQTYVAGNTVEGAMAASGPYREFYMPDGTIRGKDYQGKWSVVADTLCFQYDPAKPADCWAARITPANEIQWIKDGKIDGTGTATPGNTNGF